MHFNFGERENPGQAKFKNIFLYPAAGRVEYNVDERYNQICNLIRNVVQQKPSTSKVRGVVTGQAERIVA